MRFMRLFSSPTQVPSDKGTLPAILVTTADHDDRVVPLHSFKYRTGGSHTATLTHTVIPPAQRVVHTSYRLAEGCIVRKKEVVIF